MKLAKAIEIETIHNDHNPNFSDAEREKAHQLGIEAMKRTQMLRDGYWYKKTEPLPGETERVNNEP